MLIGHLPAGYLVSKALMGRERTHAKIWPWLLASLFPDLDLLYFYLIDGQKSLHHNYWTHLPMFWLALAVLTVILLWVVPKASVFKPWCKIMFANLLLHMVLDSFNTTGIFWLAPFSSQAFFLFDIPAKYGFWIFNYLFHWTFLVELFLVAVASLSLWLPLGQRAAGQRLTRIGD